MRPIIFGLAMALIAGALSPATAFAASKPTATKEDAALAVARKTGMAEAPPLAAATGVTCQVVDARFLGKNVDKKTKVSTSIYEVDCDKGLGFIVFSPSPGTPTSVHCVFAAIPQADGKPSTLACKLPGNANPGADLAPLLAKAGIGGCVPEVVKGVGSTTSTTYIEVACPGGTGYLIQAALPGNADAATTAKDCLLYDASETNLKCTIHDKAYRMTVLDSYAAAANNGCAVKDRRYVGASQSGSVYWEASCQDGKGYMYKTDGGKFTAAYACEKASGIVGGCELTDTKEAQTAQAGLYTRLSQKAGTDCQVSKYAPFPIAGSKDVVEMSCSNRPDALIGIFAGPNDKSYVYDCAHALIAGYKCSFTKPSDAYSFITADLKKAGKMECGVSNIRVMGKTTKGTTMVETACSDGLKGYILEYTTEPLTPIAAIGCAFSQDCKLPGNK
jgi:hypothetical protein